jgi:hypothetical protein
VLLIELRSLARSVLIDSCGSGVLDSDLSTDRDTFDIGAAPRKHAASLRSQLHDPAGIASKKIDFLVALSILSN